MVAAQVPAHARHPWRWGLAVITVAVLGLASLLPGPAQASFAAVGDTAYNLSDDGGQTWNQPSPRFLATFKDVAHGNGTWVAVGTAGQIYRSTDGIDWQPQTSGTTLVFNGVTYGDNQFVAVGPYVKVNNTSALQAVHTSPDGITWTQTPVPVYYSHTLQSVAYGNGMYVAVGNTGMIITSEDATVWTHRVSGVTSTLYDVAHGNGQFTAVGASGVILTSADGIAWLPETSGSTTITLYSVAYANDLWVVVGSSKTILTKDVTASTWTARTASVTSSPIFYGVAYGGGRWTAVGTTAPNATTYSSPLVTSTDGITWVGRPVSGHVSYGPRAVAHDGSMWIGVGTYSIVRSHDGLDWIAGHTYVRYHQYAAAYNGTHWVSGGFYGSIFTSPDGEEWTARYSGMAVGKYITGVAWGAGTWVAVGTSLTPTTTCQGTGFIITSPDGIHWTQKSTPTTSALCGVAYGPGRFIAVGLSGTMFTSPDGNAWTAVTGNPSNTLYGIAYGGGNWTTVGASGTIRTSPEGTIWTSRTVTGVAGTLYAVAYDPSGSPNKWVAAGAAAKIVKSADSATWSLATGMPSGTPTTTVLRGVAAEDGAWVAVASTPAPYRTYRSTDGNAWTDVNSVAGAAQDAVASSHVPALECKTFTSPVLVDADVTFGGYGGAWPYSWSAPGSDNVDPADGSSVTRSYSAPGTYQVTLTDDDGTSRICNVTVEPPPLVCGPSVQAVDADVEVYFVATGGTPGFTWSAPGSATQTPLDDAFMATYANGGTFTVTVADAGVPAQTAHCTVTVDGIPVDEDEEEGTGDGEEGGEEGTTDPDPGTGTDPTVEPRPSESNTPVPPAQGGSSPTGQSPPSSGTPPAGEGGGVIQVPVAHAGANQLVAGGDRVTLDGSQSTMWGTPQYRWRQLHGPAVVLHGAATATPWFLAPEAGGILVFELQIEDGAGTTAAASVSIDVVAKLLILPAPQGEFTVAFASNRPGLQHAWAFGDGATGQGAQVLHTYADAGTYTVLLTVTGEDGTTLVAQSEVALQPATGTPAKSVPVSAAQAEAGLSPLVPVAFLAFVSLAVLAGILVAMRRRKPAAKSP